jgi:molybdopterin molybdotransferase
VPLKPMERCLPEIFFDWIDRQVMRLAARSASLQEVAGRVLAEDVTSGIDIPDRPTAVNNGYAVRAADAVGASDYSPLPLRLMSDRDPVAPGTTCRICSGDSLPPGTDAVLPLELAEQLGSVVQAAGAVASGSGVYPKGDECQAGETLLTAGRPLRPQDVARLALAGFTEVPVRERPSVRVMLAGRYRQNADGPMLMGLIRRDGGEAQGPEIAGTGSLLEQAIAAPGADLILVAGATGPDDGEIAPQVLASLGDLIHHGVAIRPGDTAGLGRVGRTPVVLLPGAPLACLFVYDLFVARLLRRWAGRNGPWPYAEGRMPLARKVASSIGCLELCRVRISDGRAEPLAVVDGRLRTAVEADGFILIPTQSEGYDAGTELSVYLYDRLA